MRVHLAGKQQWIRAIMFVLLFMPLGQVGAQDQTQATVGDDVKALAAKATPKTSDGHPDLNGAWVAISTGSAVGGGGGGKVEGNVHTLYFGNILPDADVEKDSVLTDNHANGETRRKARQTKNMPEYKPEFRAKVEEMGKDPNHFDPTQYSCLPAGVPRMGIPAMIVQIPGRVVFLYTQTNMAAYSTYRIIPTDGRPHRTGADYDPNPNGDPVGHWEGDTLVIDVTGFDDSTWFGQDGYFHTDAMRVTERFTRKGDTLEYSATVEDPNVLTKPYDLNPATLKLGSPNDIPYNGDYPCDIQVHDFKAHADHTNHL